MYLGSTEMFVLLSPLCSVAALEDEYHNYTDDKTYYGIAHTMHEPINEQPSILVNGTLKNYQVTCM